MMTPIRFIKILIFALFVCANGADTSAQVNDSRQFELIVVTNAHHTAADAKLVESLKSEPSLAGIAARCKLHTFTPTSELYKQRYASVMPITELPMIALARWDGGVVYKAAGSGIPEAPELVNQLRHFASLARSVEQPVNQANNSDIYEWSGTPNVQDCPPCRLPTNPDQSGFRPSVVGPGLIPDTINVQPQFNVPGSVWLFIAIAIGLFSFIGLLMVAFLVLVILRR